MDTETSTNLLASQMGHFSVSVGILRSLVDRGILWPAEAAGIVRDAAKNLPQADEIGWVSVQRGMYEKVAQRLEARTRIEAAA